MLMYVLWPLTKTFQNWIVDRSTGSQLYGTWSDIFYVEQFQITELELIFNHNLPMIWTWKESTHWTKGSASTWPSRKVLACLIALAKLFAKVNLICLSTSLSHSLIRGCSIVETGLSNMTSSPNFGKKKEEKKFLLKVS